jgi:hypothetical protein
MHDEQSGMNSLSRVRALGRPAAGLCPWPAREKGFPSNLLLTFN